MPLMVVTGVSLYPDSPICLKTGRTFVVDAPVERIAKLKKCFQQEISQEGEVHSSKS